MKMNYSNNLNMNHLEFHAFKYLWTIGKRVDNA